MGGVVGGWTDVHARTHTHAHPLTHRSGARRRWGGEKKARLGLTLTPALPHPPSPSPSASCGTKASRAHRPERRHGPPEPVMILPQVHLRKPCYDFYFL